MTKMWEAAVVFLLLAVASVSPHCTSYGVCNNHLFVPAPPGHTPTCAKPGSTFCEIVDHYPRQLIRYLIEKWGYDFNTLLSDESTSDFSDRKVIHHVPHPIYGPPQPYAHVPSPIIQPAYTFGPFNITTQIFEGGYPDRRYKIEPHFLTNALQQPHEPTSDGQFYYKNENIPRETSFQQSIQWWKRYKRSKDDSLRKKRQAGSGGTALCPTRASYIMPRAALNTRGNWMYTVNLNEVDNRYTQLVRSEICVSNTCSGLCSLPNGYSSRCQQKYVQKRLVALESNGERLYSDVFWFPHCCICEINFTGSG